MKTVTSTVIINIEYRTYIRFFTFPFMKGQILRSARALPQFGWRSRRRRKATHFNRTDDIVHRFYHCRLFRLRIYFNSIDFFLFSVQSVNLSATVAH